MPDRESTIEHGKEIPDISKYQKLPPERQSDYNKIRDYIRENRLGGVLKLFIHSDDKFALAGSLDKSQVERYKGMDFALVEDMPVSVVIAMALNRGDGGMEVFQAI